MLFGYRSLRAGTDSIELPMCRCLLPIAIVTVTIVVLVSALPLAAQTGAYPDVDEVEVHAQSGTHYRLAYGVEHGGSSGSIWITTPQGIRKELADVPYPASAYKISFSPDGRLVAYSDHGGSGNLLNIDSGEVRRFTHASRRLRPRVESVAWSSDGTFLVYSLNNDTSGRGNELWIEEADGLNKRKLGNAYDFNLSSDGRYINYPLAYGSTYTSFGVVENLYTGSRTRAEFENWGWTWSSTFSFTPDGKHIYYSVNSPDITYSGGDLDVRVHDYWIVDRDGRNKKKIASGATSDLIWSPDGTRFLYRGHRKVSVSLQYEDDGPWHDVEYVSLGDYIIADANGTTLGVFDRSGSCDSIYWEPDSEHVVLRFSQRIIIANAYTLATRGLDYDYHQWSPDLRKIAYNIVGSGVWVMDADGSNRRKLADCADNCTTDYVWSPDSRYVAYTIPSASAGNDLWIADVDGGNEYSIAGSDGDRIYPLEWLPS